MDIIDFEANHARLILQGGVHDERIRPSESVDKFVEGMVYPDWAFTGVDKGRVIACAGIFPIWEGVAEAWFLGSQHMYDFDIQITRALVKGLPEWMEKYNLHRVQANVREDWPKARRWAKFLGMEEEGIMRSYTPDKHDFIRFARVVR